MVASDAASASRVRATVILQAGKSARTSPAKAPSKTTREVNPPGDIPDDQAFVPYSPGGAGFVVSVPEGWARTEAAGATTFTDKLNSVRMQAANSINPPTVHIASTTGLAAVKASEPRVTGASSTSVLRKAGRAILLTYQRDSAPNDVSGKIIREAVERYEFWKGGVRVTLTLSGPVGADNVDPWRTVTNSFAWK